MKVESDSKSRSLSAIPTRTLGNYNHADCPSHAHTHTHTPSPPARCAGACTTPGKYRHVSDGSCSPHTLRTCGQGLGYHPGTATTDTACVRCLGGMYSSRDDTGACLNITGVLCGGGQGYFHGNVTHDDSCKECTAGFFSTIIPGRIPCTPHESTRSICAPGAGFSAGTTFVDNRCIPCDNGRYSNTTDNSQCHSFSKCFNGEILVAAGTAKQDSSCALPDSIQGKLSTLSAVVRVTSGTLNHSKTADQRIDLIRNITIIVQEGKNAVAELRALPAAKKKELTTSMVTTLAAVVELLSSTTTKSSNRSSSSQSSIGEPSSSTPGLDESEASAIIKGLEGITKLGKALQVSWDEDQISLAMDTVSKSLDGRGLSPPGKYRVLCV